MLCGPSPRGPLSTAPILPAGSISSASHGEKRLLGWHFWRLDGGYEPASRAGRTAPLALPDEMPSSQVNQEDQPECLWQHRLVGTLGAPPTGLLSKDFGLGRERVIQLHAGNYHLVVSSPGCTCSSIPGQIPAALLIKKEKKKKTPRS